MSNSPFRHWLVASGAGVGPVMLEPHGVFARDAIAKDDLVAAVPADLVITEAMARQSPAGIPLVEAGIHHGEALFAAFLLRERGRQQSFWAPYLAQLPESFTALPHYHGVQLSPMLTGTRALQIIRNNVQWARAAHQVAVRTVPAFKDYSLDDYLWGFFAAYSRIFSAQVRGEKVSILAPLIDAFNTAIEANAVWRCDVETGDCSVIALQDIASGQEIRVSYGGKSNTALFTRYGFTLPDNPVKEAILPIDPNADEAHAPRVRNGFDDVAAPRIFATLRGHGLERPVDLDAERDVLTRVRLGALAQQRLISTVHEAPSPDLEKLAKASARVCADERAALDWWIGLANKALPILDLTGEVRRTVLAHAAQEEPDYRTYLQQLMAY